MTSTRRRFEGSELIVASHNTGKISEIAICSRPLAWPPSGLMRWGLMSLKRPVPISLMPN